MSNEVFPAFPGVVFEEREPFASTEVYASPGGQEQRVSRMAERRWRWQGRGILRQSTGAPSPYQAQGEVDCLLRFHDRHKGAGASFLFNDPVDTWRSNLFPYSEPLLAQMAHSAGVTQGSLTDGGLSNGMIFPALAQADNANFTPTLVVGTSYVVSAFVKMTDLGAPVVGLNSTSGDFTLVSDNDSAGYHDAVVRSLGGNLYRVSSARTATSGGALAAGVFRYAAQSGRGFTMSGFQIEAAVALPTVYTLTSGAAFSPQKRVRFSEDGLSTRRVRYQWYEVEFELVSVLGET